MDQIYGENYYSNYSTLCNNLTAGPNKFKNLNKIFSPVLIESYGSNNFVVELKPKTKNSKNTDDYDYIENELKSTKKTKAYTAYTEISNEENLFFNSQNQPPNPRYFRDYTNYNVFYPDNIYNTNNYFYDRTNNQIYKKDEIDTLIYPSEKIYIPKKNINKIIHNRTDLRSQRFSASFISKSPNNKQRSPQKKIFRKKDINGIKVCTNAITEKKERDVSKSKNQLEDFNIDKLKEIGDNLAMRYMKKIKPKYRFNMHNKQNYNSINDTINNLAVISDKKEKHGGIINKMIMIEQKRKESKNRLNKLNLFNKTELQIGRKNSKSHIFEDNNNINNNKIYEVRTLNEENENNFIKGKKFLKVNKNKIDQITLKNHSPSPLTNKITVNNLLNRKIYNLKVNLNNSSNSEINNSKIKSIKDIKNSNYEKQEMLKTNVNNNIKKINYYIKNKTYINGIIKNQPNKIINTEIYDNTDRQFNNKTYTEVKIDRNVPKFRNRDRISVNRRLNMGKSRDKLNEKTKNINHKYLESVNIKNYKNTKKTEHSFNNVILPLK